jgi:DNA repair exonuclease SbcCD ATPase subunit
MRPTILVITFFFVAALAVDCTSTEGKSAAGPKPSETAAAQLDKAKTETKEAARAMQDYAYAEKAELVGKMNKELGEIQEELDRLSAKVDRSSDTAKADAKAKLEAVREKWARAKKNLARAESATESDWDDVKRGFRTSYGELKDSVAKTRQWLSDKIEP